MKINKSPFSIQENDPKELDNSKDYPNFADLMREQKVSNDGSSTVHRRRDLDSLG